MVRMKKPKAIILDIEGTTTSTKFVAESLFPYIRSHLKKYLHDQWGHEELLITVDRLRQQSQRDRDQGVNVPLVKDEDAAEDEIIRSLVANVLWQMDEKKKNTALKQIQILVWVYGYEKGHLKGHVFDDVPPALHEWKEEKSIKLYVYSTGMVVAQQLLFSCSTHGNLLPLIDNYFDVLVGPKTDPESFRKISEQIEESSERILFLTDNPKEARAAIEAGCKSILLKRPGNKPLTENDNHEFTVIKSFDEINFY